MAETTYSLTNLVPELGRVLVGDWTSPEGLSAVFISLLFTMAIGFAMQSIRNYLKAKNHLKFYQDLLSGLSAEQLLDRRRELVNTALKNEEHGRLWREFDESLVHIPLKERLCNTLDAAHFFNTHTIARGLTENRLLAAVPGFLTAIGVIGTFAGLQLGLGPLGELEPSNAKVEDLTHGIFGMIGGASIAFMTSVWGVFTSVAFNFFEKALERNIRSKITIFQNEVDYLYPRITAEQSLSNIEDFTRQSNDRLAELDEKIGHKMQEAMQQASTVISDSMTNSLNRILGPAIEKLVDNAHSGSEKALESLLERFLDGVGNAGDNQKIMMEQASENMAKASTDMTSGLQQFTTKLEGQVSGMMDKNAEVLDQVNQAVITQLESQGLREQERQDRVDQQFLESQDAQKRVMTGIDNVLSSQKDQSKELLAGLTAVIDRFESLSNSHQHATTAMESVSTELKAGSNQLGLLSANLKSAIDAFASNLSEALEYTDAISHTNSETAHLFNSVVQELNRASEVILSTSSTLDDAAGKAQSGLTAVDQHFNQLAKSLQEHLTSVQEQVAALLSDYSERVQSQTVTRLNTWNEQTNNYIASMTDAVRTLSSVVDEIDGKVSLNHSSGSL